jgi:hypothetical protein
MTIVFDEVVGTVGPAEPPRDQAPAASEHAATHAAEPDPERLYRELQVIKQRDARLHAD